MLAERLLQTAPTQAAVEFGARRPHVCGPADGGRAELQRAPDPALSAKGLREVAALHLQPFLTRMRVKCVPALARCRLRLTEGSLQGAGRAGSRARSAQARSGGVH